MRKLGRKCISALLVLALLVSVLPIGAAPAQAAGEGESSTVTVSFSQNGQAVTAVPYGSTATMKKAETAINARSADTGKVDFYLGEANDTTGIKMDTGTVEFEEGAYTASVDVTLDDEKGVTEVGTITITADFGGYALEGDEDGDSLAPNTGSAQLTVTKASQDAPVDDEGYTIDYAAETITATSGYELSTNQSTVATSPFSVTPGGKVYVRKAETETHTASDWAEVNIPARPAAPTNAGTVTNQTQNTIMIGSENGQEYRCGTGGTWGDWQTDSDGLITFENLSPGTEYTIQNRYQSGKDENGQEHFASFTNSTTSVTLPSITTTSLETGYVGVAYSDQLEAVVAEGTNVTWSLENSSLPAGLTLNGDGTISGTPTTAGQFSVIVKVAIFGELGQERAGTMGQLSITISKSDAELGGLTVSGHTGFDGHFQYGDTITVTFTPERKADTSTNALALAANTATLTYTSDEGEEVTLATATAQADGSFELTYDTKEKQLPIGENLTLTVSYGGSNALNPTEETVTVTLEPAPLKNVPTISGESVSGKTLTANYTKQDDETVTYQWNRNGTAIANATGQTYTLTTEDIDQKISVTVTASDENHTGSMTSEAVTISAPSTPSTPSTPGKPEPPTTDWDTAKDEIADAEPGDVVTVEIEADDTEVPAEIFESIAGKDVTVEFELGDGLSWTVNGKDIPDDAALTDLDLGVALDTDGIPAEVINTITGERESIQLTLAYDGEFGFTMTLTAPLGKENAGYWANLYHYDEDAEALNFEAAARLDETGNVSIPFSHASQYAIVIDDHSHATVPVSEIFLDISPDAWYKDAVQYTYDNGLMTGVSAKEFAPEATTTRAMIVSILARLENVTSAESAGFADVNDEWYATAVNWAASVGVVSGTDENTFSPNAAITREQLAAMLMNYTAYKGQDVSARADLNGYTDQPSVWATETMQWAVAEGLISGVTNTQLQPQGNATRAQVAAILQRFLDK